MQLTLAKSVTTAVTPSPRVLETAAMFGLGVDDAHRIDIVPRTTLDVPRPGVVFITGPSGGGKSTVLSLIAQQCREHGVNAIQFDDLPPLPDAPLVDVFDVPIERATSLLAMAGLGDAFVMLRKPSELSDGQRYRLRLAQAMHLASEQPCVILADEFGATLDRLTASIIARNVRKWTARAGCTFICATTHDDLLEALEPDVLVYKGLGDEIRVFDAAKQQAAKTSNNVMPRSLDASMPLAIEPGTLADYHLLAAFHYKGAKPGAVTSVLRMVHKAPTVVGRYLQRRDESAIVGVLVRSLPHLACSLRDEATGQRYHGMTLKERAAMLNREIRTIARVVVHPQWRGLGLAVELVKHALANPDPDIVYTEALAAMGRVHPFFDKAGMTRYERPPRASHARLIDAIQHLGLDPVTLALPRLVRNHFAERDAQWQLFLRELKRWHRSGARRSRSKNQEPTIDDMLAAARDQLVTLPVYYLYRH
jgi:ABC-type lipoprotein export system ATPase subunit/GNAT superfamily N-acetyltransferase